MRQKQEEKTQLPGVLATIAAGFDITAKHFWLTLIPAILDSFLWLGPRLSIRQLVEQMVMLWQQEAVQAGLSVEALLEIAPRTNLFTALSVPIIGVPALMVGLTPEKTPLSPQVTEIVNNGRLFSLFLALSLVGLLLTAIYYRLVAGAVRQSGTIGIGQLLRGVGKNWIQLLGLGIMFFITAMMLYLPLLVLGLGLSLVSNTLGSLVILFGPVLIIWVLIYLSFAPHGLVLNGRSLRQAIVESAQLVRVQMWPVVFLLLTIILISRILDWLLLMADDGSWLTLGGILAHAFVSTALLAATFIFYRDRYVLMFGRKQTAAAATGNQRTING